MFEFVTQHEFWIAVVAYWLFSAAVSALPEPGANAGPAYLWLFRFVHTVAGNITTALGNRIPGVKALILLLILPLLLSTSACAAHYTARASWLTYRGAVTTKTPSDVYFAQLTKNLSDLNTAIRNFTARKEGQ